jgi:ribose transport system ATP-binding protein
VTLGFEASRPAQPPRAGAGPGDLLLRLTGVSKRFPGVLALDGVDFDLRRGEVHVLFGENGAGKSTLINVIAGTFPRDSGGFTYQGREISHLTPHQARVIGISPVFQEFSLVPELTIEENMFLGREIVSNGVLNRPAMRARALEVMAELAFDLDPKRKVRGLARANQQMVEIAKAFLTEVKLLILDEPTASLTDAEVAKLFDLVGKLKQSGTGIIYVSHRLREIKQIGDRITILRDGRKIATVNSGAVTETALVELMTGRKIDILFPQIPHRPTRNSLEVEHLTLADGTVTDVSLSAHAGEITGIAGLVGCGKSELIRAVYGLESVVAGAIRIHGEPVARPTPATSLKVGVCYFPSDRVGEGLALARPVRENASMASLDLPLFAWHRILRRKSERKAVQDVMDRLKLRPSAIERVVANFSGGNRQKVVLARGLTRDVGIYLLDEPTVGIDVGAKAEVYELMKALVAQGNAIVLVSSELPEMLNLCNRLYVMHRSRLVAELTGADITEEAVLAHFFQRDSTGGADTGVRRRAGA